MKCVYIRYCAMWNRQEVFHETTFCESDIVFWSFFSCAHGQYVMMWGLPDCFKVILQMWTWKILRKILKISFSVALDERSVICKKSKKINI